MMNYSRVPGESAEAEASRQSKPEPSHTSQAERAWRLFYGTVLLLCASFAFSMTGEQSRAAGAAQSAAASSSKPSSSRPSRAHNSSTSRHPKSQYRTARFTERGRHYSIEVDYPQFAGLGSVTGALNKIVRARVLKELRDSKSRLSLDEAAEGPRGYLHGKYKVCLLTDKIISVRFSFSGYSPAAAHPVDWTVAFTYQLKPRTQFTTDDLFKKDIDQNLVLSSLCRRQLSLSEEQFTFSWLQEGVAPESEKFQTMTLTPSGLWVTFDEYQVNAYAAGPYSVKIPYASIKALVPRSSPIYDLAQSQNDIADPFLVLTEANWKQRLQAIDIGTYSMILENDSSNSEALDCRAELYKKLGAEKHEVSEP